MLLLLRPGGDQPHQAATRAAGYGERARCVCECRIVLLLLLPSLPPPILILLRYLLL